MERTIAEILAEETFIADAEEPALISLGGPGDWWNIHEAERGTFPSTTSYRAERFYAEHDEPMQIYSYGHLVIDFIEDNLTLSDGEFYGKPFNLMMWQKRLLLEMYEVTPRFHPTKGGWVWARVHRWALVGIPKKNGKTELAAALGLYAQFASGEMSPNVICAAASDEQADLVFGAASTMVENGVLDTSAEVQRKKIISPHNNGQFVRVAASAGTNDGKNISDTIIDELHEWIKPDARQIFVVLTGGSGARFQPMNMMITTAGFDQDSLCYERYEYGKTVRDGIVEDRGFYFCWFEAPEDADYTDPDVWKAANPSWGLILQREFYDDMLKQRTEAEFRRYYLNQWTEALEIWEAAQYWDDLAGDFELDPELPTFVGIDIGRKHDSSAVVIAQYDAETDKVMLKPKIWSNPFQRGTSAYGDWRISLAEIEKYLREIRAQFPVASAPDPHDEQFYAAGPAFLYDPHLFGRSAEMLEIDGLNMIEVPQTDTRLVPASQRFFEFCKTGRILHDADPIMRRHIRAVVAVDRERGWRINKIKSTKAIDGAIAAAMALFYASEIEPEPTVPNVW